jgi:DNA topoisomerase-1
VAAIVRRCQDLPGHELFQYLGEDGRRHTIGSSDVNTYLQGLAGEEFTAKDFRTWAGTVLAARALEPVERASPGAVNAAVKRVAEHLGNTPAICRKCYVHPAVIDAFLDGSLGRIAASIPRRASSVAGERMVMKLLERVKRSAAAS